MLDAEEHLGIKFDLVIVDHLGLLSPVTPSKGGRLGWESQGEIGNDLKFSLARNHRKACWAGVQAKMGGQAGTLASIGLSYLISQPAEIAVTITRNEEEFMDPDTPGMVQMRLAKYRYGGTASFPVHVDYSTCRITRWADEEQAEASE